MNNLPLSLAGKFNFSLPSPRFLTFLFILLQGHFLTAQVCDPPPNCGTNPQYLCDSELTNFNWAMMPTGAGSFDIFVRASINAAVPVTYFLMSGNNVVATLSGASGTFEDIQPGCYRLVICASSDPNVTYYCCKDLYCDFESIGCCELKYQFFTDVSNPVWDFGDNTTSTQQNTVHE